MAQVAKDFGPRESCLDRWLGLADIEDGVGPGVTSSESAELREARKRIRLLEQVAEVVDVPCPTCPGTLTRYLLPVVSQREAASGVVTRFHAARVDRASCTARRGTSL